MKQKKTLLILIAVFVLLLVGAYVLYERLGADVDPQQLATGDQSTEGTGEAAPTIPAPDFTVFDLEGNEVRLSDFKGKPVIVNFWASWCGPCQMEMPDFNIKHQEYGDQIQFLMVNMTDGSRETLKSASGFIADSGYTFPVYYDTQLEAAMAYGVYALPTTYFIDTDGNLVTRATQAIDGETLQTGIDMILP